LNVLLGLLRNFYSHAENILLYKINTVAQITDLASLYKEIIYDFQNRHDIGGLYYACLAGHKTNKQTNIENIYVLLS
jgi:hypothetical protein